MSSSDPEHEGIQPARAPLPAPRRPEAVEPGAEPAAPAERRTDLLGQEIREKRRWPIAGLLYLILALLFLWPSVAHRSPGSFIAFLGFGSFALVYLRFGPRPLRLRLTEEGVELGPGTLLPYGRIQEVFAPGAGKAERFPIYLLHERGQVVLPAKLRIASAALYDFLRVQPLGRREIPAVEPLFRDFLCQQLAIHGAGPIYVYHARQPGAPTYLPRSWRENGWRRLSLALLLAGVLWSVAYVVYAQLGLARQLEFLGLIPAVLVSSALFFLVSLVPRRHSHIPRRFRNATLIVTPDGMALSQGTLQGELRWHELRGIKTKTGSFTLSRPDVSFALSRSDVVVPGIELQVQGASILVADIYHWPIAHIDQVIRHYAGL